MPEDSFYVGPPHHKPTCKPACKRVICRPTIHLKLKAWASVSLDSLVAGDHLLTEASRGCETSLDKLDDLVTARAFDSSWQNM